MMLVHYENRIKFNLWFSIGTSSHTDNGAGAERVTVGAIGHILTDTSHQLIHVTRKCKEGEWTLQLLEWHQRCRRGP